MDGWTLNTFPVWQSGVSLAIDRFTNLCSCIFQDNRKKTKKIDLGENRDFFTNSFR